MTGYEYSDPGISLYFIDKTTTKDCLGLTEIFICHKSQYNKKQSGLFSETFIYGITNIINERAGPVEILYKFGIHLHN